MMNKEQKEEWFELTWKNFIAMTDMRGYSESNIEFLYLWCKKNEPLISIFDFTFIGQKISIPCITSENLTEYFHQKRKTFSDSRAKSKAADDDRLSWLEENK